MSKGFEDLASLFLNHTEKTDLRIKQLAIENKHQQERIKEGVQDIRELRKRIEVRNERIEGLDARIKALMARPSKPTKIVKDN